MSGRFVYDRDFSRKKVNDWSQILRHTWEGLKTGSRLFKKNVSISTHLLKKRASGHPLNLQENKLLLRTASDTFKLVPFSFFVIVPFAELLLPVALWVWPNMLPSTFKELISDDSRRLRRLRAKKEMATFFEDVIKRKSEQEDDTKAVSKAKEWSELQSLMENYRKVADTETPFPSAKELIKYAKLFRDEFQLENMPTEHLQAISRLLGLNPYGFHSHVVLQLRHAVTRLLAEDRHIRWEGVDAMHYDDLKEACKARGMLPDEAAGEKEMRALLEHWLELSSVKDMPVSLLLWSRSYAVAGDRTLLTPPPEDALKTEIAENNTNVEKYRHKVEILIQKLKELEDLEASTLSSPAQDVAIEDTTEGEHHDRAELLKKIQELQGQVHTKKKIIEAQNDILKQQIELIARLRELPSLQNLPRRHSKEMRAELKKMYDQFDAELKQLEDTIRVAEEEPNDDNRFYPENK